MRPIKFRAWDKIGKEWVLTISGGQSLNHETGKLEYTYSDTFLVTDWQTLKAIAAFPGNYEIEQSTGLKDKKRTKEYPEGQEIYEGDKIMFDDNKFWCVVRWNERGFYQLWRNGMIHWTLWIDDYYHNSGHRKDLEVIGNIHDKEASE